MPTAQKQPFVVEDDNSFTLIIHQSCKAYDIEGNTAV